MIRELSLLAGWKMAPKRVAGVAREPPWFAAHYPLTVLYLRLL